MAFHKFSAALIPAVLGCAAFAQPPLPELRIEPAAVGAEPKQWHDSMKPLGRAERDSQKAINQAAVKGLIGETIAKIKESSTLNVSAMRAAEKYLAASKPPL